MIKHIAFIMDGNRRWAKRRGLPVGAGYAEGARAMKRVLRRCVERGIEAVSVYAFSTENWKRPKEEIDKLFEIVRDSLDDLAPICEELGIRVMASGDTTKFPEDLQKTLGDMKAKTTLYDKCIFNMCINYGGRQEIVRAANLCKGGVTEEGISAGMYTAPIGDPDLVVRTSGEERVSNFMIWQIAYSELIFVKKFWPSMNAKRVDKCIAEFEKRKRRFGK